MLNNRNREDKLATSEGNSKAPGPEHPENFDDGDAFMQKMRRQMLQKKKALESSSAPSRTEHSSQDDQLDFEAEADEEEEGEGGSKEKEGTGWNAGDADDETDKEKARRKAIKERAKEYEALREELKSKHRAARVMTGEERAKYDAVRFPEWASDHTEGTDSNIEFG